MVRQGLTISVQPVSGTLSTYSVLLYSTGWEDGQKVVERHILIAPLSDDLGNVHPGNFKGWLYRAISEACGSLVMGLTPLELETLSGPYAHAEDAEDKAMHRS